MTRCGALALALPLLIGACRGAPPFTDLDGTPRRPLECGENRAAVVVFITVDCPIANRCVPEINRIYGDYREKGVEMTLVHVDPDVTREAAATHAREFGLLPPVVLDPKHVLVAATGARVTPEAAVFDSKGTMAYRGRINDQFPRLGDTRAMPKVHDLRDALDALLAGRKIARPRTKAVGCYIPD